VARMGGRRGACSALVGSLRERHHLEDLDVDGSIILQWIFKKWGTETWAGLLWIGYGQMEGCCQ